MVEDRWAAMIPIQAQGEIINEMAREMVSAITGEWVYATYVISRFGGQVSGSFQIYDVDGTTRLGQDRMSLDSHQQPVWLPFDLSEDLKQVMFSHGKGSWFTMVLTVKIGGSVEAKFDYDSKPKFDDSLLGVSPYYVSREQLAFFRDRDHQPDWYRVGLEKYTQEEEKRLDVWAARNQAWKNVGDSGEVSNSLRLVVLPSGVGVIVTDGYSDPSPTHPNDAGFELYLPSAIFTSDLPAARQEWPCSGLNYLIDITTRYDIDWVVRTRQGLVALTYSPSLVSAIPNSWRDQTTEDNTCGVIVGVPYPGMPDYLDGPIGRIRLFGVLPARPDEWKYLQNGGTDAGSRLLSRLMALTPEQLASPERPSVVN